MKPPFSAYDFFAHLSAGFFIFCAIEYSFDGSWFLGRDHTPIRLAFFIGVSYVAGHLIAHLSSYVLEHKIVRERMGAPEDLLFGNYGDQYPLVFRRLFPGHYSRFPETTQRRVLERAGRAGIPEPGRGLFLHCHPIALREEASSLRLRTFIAQYGFCRNTCLTSALSVLTLCSGLVVGRCNGAKLAWMAFAIIVAVGMFYRYLKFFKQYTEEVFRTYAGREEPVCPPSRSNNDDQLDSQSGVAAT